MPTRRISVCDPTPARSAAAASVIWSNGRSAKRSSAGLQDALRVGLGDVRLATFDLSPRVLEAVRDGPIEFAVDQQAYLQGYLPIVLLAQKIRYGLFAGEGS